ncbi:MAG: T9SS type A sorting domain-containing protein, partial [Bacteroidota bacterium]
LASFPFVEVQKGESFCCSGVTGRYVEIRVTLFRQQTVNISPIFYDLTIECCDVYPNTPPTISSSRGCNQDTIRVAAGQPLSFTVTGNDIDTNQAVTITSTELPVGATMTPALPVVGNPSQTVFNWVTDFSQVGVYNFAFEANDIYCYSATCPVIVDVVPCPTIQCSGSGISCVGLCNGRATVSISGNPTNFTYTWNTSPIRNTQSIDNLCPGVYQVVTYDGFACLDSCTIVIPTDPCGGFQTFTQGGWGATPKGKNVASYLKSKFASVFPTGLTIGCNNRLRLTSWNAVVDFLPSGNTARALPSGTLSNPGQSYQNVLAGQLVAATLNVNMDSAIVNFAPATGTLGNLVIASGLFGGWTINQLIAEANRAIGGCGSVYGFSDLNIALDLFNNNYNNGEFFSTTVNRCYLSCPIVGSGGTLRTARTVRPIIDAEDLEIFPNPASESINVRFVSSTDCFLTMDIMNLNGGLIGNLMNRQLVEGELVEEKFQINHLTPGVYIVRMSDGVQTLLRRVAIVK